jgi:hypothetical protein
MCIAAAIDVSRVFEGILPEFTDPPVVDEPGAEDPYRT